MKDLRFSLIEFDLGVRNMKSLVIAEKPSVARDPHSGGAREYPGAAALAAQFGFDGVLCICDADNAASETVILKTAAFWKERNM